MFKKKKKEPLHIPQSNADSIPYNRVYQNGVFEIKRGYFSKSYLIPPVNFKTAPEEKIWKIAEEYAKFLGSFGDNVTAEITIYNDTVNIMDFQREVMLPMKADALNEYRMEYNNMLLEKMAGAKNNLRAVKLLTVTVQADDIEKALENFIQVDRNVSDGIVNITKHAPTTLSTMERLELLNSIYHQDDTVPLCRKRTIQGHEVESFSLENCEAQGITTKDVIAPEGGMEFSRDTIRVGNSYARSYYISNFPNWIKGTMLTDLASLPANMLVSAYFDTIPQDEAIKLIRNKSTNIASTILENQKRAARSGFDSTLVSPELQDAKAETKELMDNITKDNGRLFTINVVVTLFANSEDELKTYQDQLKTLATKNLLTIRSLGMRQEQGFNSSLPLGNNQLLIERLMTTETVASIVPFDVKEIRQKNGMYYGLNAVSKNMILYDRTTDINPNGCILGMPGAGKSFSAKREMWNVLLNTDDEVYVIDPEGIDYTPMAEAIGGSVIRLANGSDVHLNPFDLNIENADDNGDPVKIKTDFIETICEIAIGGRYGLSPIEKTMIDRCVSEIYVPYIEHLKRTGKTIDPEKAPTMHDFYNQLLMQPNTEAQTIALSIERYVKGALDIFAYSTNVEIDNRFTVYNIKEIGAGLKELGLQICLDNIWNKMISNKASGKRTWIYIDEFYLMMQKPSSASYIAQIWKRARKWNGIPTAITQNVEDMLKSEEARTIINNCSFIIMLGQSAINKQQLSTLFSISPEEQKYISVAKPGMGIIRIGEDIIPMDDEFPKDTKMYHIMTTKPSET